MLEGFLSYARIDDEHENGCVVRFANRLAGEVSAQLGNDFRIFVDRESVEWGQRWRRCIDLALGEYAVFIPILSPRFLNRPDCIREYQQFLAKEKTLETIPDWQTIDRLILPLQLRKIESQVLSPEISAILEDAKTAQIVDIEDAIEPENWTNGQFRSGLIKHLAKRICKLVRQFEGLNQSEGQRIEHWNMLNKLKVELGEFSKSVVDLPTTTPQGLWLEREELTALQEFVKSENPGARFVIGSPGCGKSSILSKLSSWCLESKIACLAIKADFMPVDVAGIGDLEEWILKERTNLVESLCELSFSEKVVVVIDQLDAIAALIDAQTGRLDVIIDFVSNLAKKSNAYLVVSMRDFDMRHDARLTALVDSSEFSQHKVLVVSDLREDQVQFALEKANLVPQGWPEAYKEFLRRPYHLKAFLTYWAKRSLSSHQIPSVDLFSSIHAIHEVEWDFLARQVDSAVLVSALTDLAARIANSEVPWQVVELNDARKKTWEQLIYQGWVVEEMGKYGFSHQSRYEFVRAKNLSSNPSNFIDHIRTQQKRLSIRPSVWHTLSYLRVKNRTQYVSTMGQLLSTVSQRHLQRLFLEFLTEVSDPVPQELEWMKGNLRTPNTCWTALWLIRKKPGWFAALESTVIPELMNSVDRREFAVMRYLEASWEIDFEKTKQLLRSYWVYKPERMKLLREVLDDVPKIDDELRLWISNVLLVDATMGWSKVQLLEKLGETTAADAIQIYAALLERRLDQVLGGDVQLLNDDEDEGKSKRISKECDTVSDRIHQELTMQSWYGLSNLIEENARQTVVSLWPWFVRSMANSNAAPFYSPRFRVEENSYLLFPPFHDSRFVLWLSDSIKRWAQDSPTEFILWFHGWQNVDSMTCQRLLTEGLIVLSSVHPTFVLQQLLIDPRRLLMGDHSDSLVVTNRLLLALVPFLGIEELATLQRFILSSTPNLGKDKKSLQTTQGRLLQNIPNFASLEGTDSLLANEQEDLEFYNRRATRNAWKDAELTQVRGQLTTEQMLESSNEQIITAIREVPDKFARWHPTDPLVGGAELLGREFGAFAEKFPARAIEIMELLESGVHEYVASHGLCGLRNAFEQSEEVYRLIRSLVSKGFNSQYFKDDVGRCLQWHASRNNGLPVDLCDQLEAWLIHGTLVESRESHDFNAESDLPAGAVRSVLWGYGFGGTVIPNEWTWLGEALRLGHCRSDPSRSDQWLAAFDKLIDRPFPIEVWRIWLHKIAYCEPLYAQIAPLLAKLFRKRNDLLIDDAGALTLHVFGSYFSEADCDEFIATLSNSNRMTAVQAAGELATIWCLHSLSPYAQRVMERRLAANDERSSRFCDGIMFTCVELWRGPEYRMFVLELLKKLARKWGMTQKQMLLSVFQYSNCLSDSASARELLYLAADAVEVDLHSIYMHLFERLKSHVASDADTVLHVCRRIVDKCKSAEESQVNWRMGGSESSLVQIAYALHRSSDQRLSEEGLRMFEDLMDLQVHGIFESLKELDGRVLN